MSASLYPSQQSFTSTPEVLWRETVGEWPPRCYFSSQAMRSFTLLELLVVLAILGLLAGLVLPALGRAKRRAQQVACINHFKQLTAAWKMYADEHDGRLVPVFYFFRGQVNTSAWVRGSMDDDVRIYPPVQAGVRDSTNVHGLMWGSLYRYHQSVGIYRCPADPSRVAAVGRARLGEDRAALASRLEPWKRQLKHESAVKVIQPLEELLGELEEGS